jgi:hypothetical protein
MVKAMQLPSILQGEPRPCKENHVASPLFGLPRIEVPAAFSDLAERGAAQAKEASLSSTDTKMQNHHTRAALQSFADYIKRNSGKFVTTEPNQLTPNETSRRKQHIEELAAATENLTHEDSTTYSQFETILGELHKLGMYPTNTLLSAVDRSFDVAV